MLRIAFVEGRPVWNAGGPSAVEDTPVPSAAAMTRACQQWFRSPRQRPSLGAKPASATQLTRGAAPRTGSVADLKQQTSSLRQASVTSKSELKPSAYGRRDGGDAKVHAEPVLQPPWLQQVYGICSADDNASI